NQHRATVTLTPDPALAAREAEAERARLKAVETTLSATERARLAEVTAILKRKQATADPPEALAKIPSLTLADLPRQNKTIPVEMGSRAGTRLLAHDLDTTGIVYLDLAFDLARLTAEQLPYLSLFSRALLETGAGGDDFIALSQRIGRETGGISAQRWTSA